MAISINHATKVISVPQADLTLISGSLYELNMNTFRNALGALLDDADGMMLKDTHKHSPEVTVGGATLARVVEIINGYTVTFTPDSQFAVRLVGGNNNIADVLNVNQVQLRSANSAGLITVTSGSGVTAQDKLDIADRVWDEAAADHAAAGSLGARVDAAVSSRAVPGDAMALSVAERAATVDRLLGRNQVGGSDGGFTVAQALASGAMNASFDGNVLTCRYGDGTVAFTRTVTRDQLDAIKSVLP